MTFPLKTRLLTAEEYQKMAEAGILTHKDKVELINGQIIEMSPIGSKHSSFVNRINALFSQLLGRKILISIQNPIVVDQYSEPEPDVAILHPSKNDYEEQLPAAKDVWLIIEVADSSLDYDREVKLPLYAKAEIPEYWIVNLQERNIEVYQNPIGEIYKQREIIQAGDQLHFQAFNLDIPAKDILK